MRRVIPRLLLAVSAATVLAACGSSGGSAAKSSSAPRTIVRTVTASATPPAPIATDSAASTGTDISGAPVPAVTGIVQPDRAGSVLTLEDFFQPNGSWSQAIVSVADQSNVQGITGDLGECGSTADLELRLNDQFQTLKFSVAEDNTSPSSSVTLDVSVSVNGHQVTAKPVAFNSIQKLSVNVSSANAVQILFGSDQQSSGCNSDATTEIYPVLFNAILN